MITKNSTRKPDIDIVLLPYFICILFVVLLSFSPIHNFFYSKTIVRNRYNVLTLENGNGEKIYIAGIYTGGDESDLNNFERKDTFNVKDKAINFMRYQNTQITDSLMKIDKARYFITKVYSK